MWEVQRSDGEAKKVSAAKVICLLKDYFENGFSPLGATNGVSYMCIDSPDLTYGTLLFVLLPLCALAPEAWHLVADWGGLKNLIAYYYAECDSTDVHIPSTLQLQHHTTIK